MLLDVLSVLLVVVTLGGWGFLVPLRSERVRLDFADRALIGIALIAATGLLANFFLPLPAPAAIATLCVGAAALLWRARAVRDSFGSRPAAALVTLLLLSGVFALGSRLAYMHGDTGLYHLQLIRWIQSSPRVLGLALIHERFGFNSIWHTLAVMLDLPGIGRRGLLLPNAALFALVFAAFLQQGLRAPRSEVRNPAAQLFAFCVIALFMTNAVLIPFSYLSIGPSYDAPTWLLALYGFWRFLRFAEAPPDVEPAEQDGNRLMVIVCALLAVLVKVAALPLVLLVPAVLRGRAGDRGARGLALLRTPLTGAGVLLGVLWVLTGLSLSGCLVFPAAGTCFPGLRWALPVEQVQIVADQITSYARHPAPNYFDARHGWAWIATWPQTMLAARPFVPVAYATLAGLAAGVLACRVVDRLRPSAGRASARPAHLHGWMAYALGTALLGAAFWFVKAPDPRFGLGFLFAVPALLLAWVGAGRPSRVGVARFLASGLALAVLTTTTSLWALRANRRQIRGGSAHAELPVAQLTQQQLGPGVQVGVPVGSTDCWDAPLPCTPVPNPRVREGRIGPWRTYWAERP